MRRISARQLFAAASLVATLLAPMAVGPAPSVQAVGVGRHGQDDCPPGGSAPR